MAALDSISELNTLLDNWRREDQENASPVNTLRRLVLVRLCIHARLSLINNLISCFMFRIGSLYGF